MKPGNKTSVHTVKCSVLLLGSTADLLLVFPECWGSEDAQRASSVPNPGMASLPDFGGFTVLLSSFTAILFLVHGHYVPFRSGLQAWHLHRISQHCFFVQDFLAALSCVTDVAGSTGKINNRGRYMLGVVGSGNGKAVSDISYYKNHSFLKLKIYIVLTLFSVQRTLDVLFRHNQLNLFILPSNSLTDILNIGKQKMHLKNWGQVSVQIRHSPNSRGFVTVK